MKLLLDTQLLIWLLDQRDASSFGVQTKAAIKEAKVVYASAVSVAEIRIKSMIGKLQSQPELLEDIAKAGCQELAFLSVHADTLVGFLQLARHDPFDRMLLSQAKVEKCQFLTTDRFLLGLNLSFIRDATK